MGGTVGSMRPFPPGPPPDRFHWNTGGQYPYSQNYELGQMGWFGPHELGTLDVQSAATTPGGVWSTLRWLTLVGSLLLAGIAVADTVIARRRHLAIG